MRGRILMSLAHAEAESGRVPTGLRLLAEAAALLPTDQRGVLHGQRGLMLMRIGRNDEAVSEFDAAIDALGERAEPEELARALLNRGVLHLAAAPGLARADLSRCAQVASAHGLTRVAYKARHNLAYVDLLAGDLPASLRAFGDLREQYAAVMPSALPVLAVDRARALLAAGLYGDADRELASALDDFRRQHLSQDYAEAQLARAEAALLAGDPSGRAPVGDPRPRRLRAPREHPVGGARVAARPARRRAPPVLDPAAADANPPALRRVRLAPGVSPAPCARWASAKTRESATCSRPEHWSRPASRAWRGAS